MLQRGILFFYVNKADLIIFMTKCLLYIKLIASSQPPISLLFSQPFPQIALFQPFSTPFCTFS